MKRDYYKQKPSLNTRIKETLLAVSAALLFVTACMAVWLLVLVVTMQK